MEEGILQPYPNVLAFLARFEAVPKINKYLTSDRYLRWPCNNANASWGGAGEQPRTRSAASRICIIVASAVCR
eukprot:scaffold1318_cov388-Prasinococcus_capsulatus_cf.AAC.1